MKVYLRDDLQEAWGDQDPFAVAAIQPGDIYRQREGRRTLRFVMGKHSCFLKYHGGIGWHEIIKNLLQGKLPVLGAMSEVEAIERVRDAGLDTMTIAGYGERGMNPARRQSFIVTDELVDTISLEDLALKWVEIPPDPMYRRALLVRVADIVRRLHVAGVNHRDLYLCHFLLNEQAVADADAAAPVYLIDLHRAQIRDAVPRRWLVKDLGGLYFSAATCGLSRTDLFRFVAHYSGRSPAAMLRTQRRFWQSVCEEGERLFSRHYDAPPAFPLRADGKHGKAT